MPGIDLIASIPVLNVADVPKAVAFYRDRLGFTPSFEFGPYAGVQLGAIEIHLDGGEHAFSARPLCCRFHVRGVDDVYEDFYKKGVVMPDERLETTPFGMRQFSLLDLDGNRITFAEPAAS